MTAEPFKPPWRESPPSEYLALSDADESRLEAALTPSGLRRVDLFGGSLTDLSALRRLSRLEILVLHQIQTLRSLRSLEGLTGLTALRLFDLRGIQSLEPLGGLGGLRVLAVEGGWTAPPMTLDSLSPLAALSELEYLYLTAVRVTDRSLRPLHGLVKLRRIEMVGTLPTEEYAQLAAALPGVECDWFAPYVVVPDGRCERCGGQQLILTGGRRWQACERCDAQRVRKHVEIFEAIRATGRPRR